MGDWDGGQSDCFHSPVRVHQSIQLGRHLARLRSVEPASVITTLDVLFHEKRKLQRDPHALVVQADQPWRYQIAVLCVQGGLPRRSQCRARNDTGAPICAEMVLRGEEDGSEDPGDAFGVCAVGLPGGGVVDVGIVTAGEEHAGEVADRGYDFGKVVAALPETVVGCLVAEDLAGLIVS